MSIFVCYESEPLASGIVAGRAGTGGGEDSGIGGVGVKDGLLDPAPLAAEETVAREALGAEEGDEEVLGVDDRGPGAGLGVVRPEDATVDRGPDAEVEEDGDGGATLAVPARAGFWRPNATLVGGGRTVPAAVVLLVLDNVEELTLD